jgi:NAD(P)-dependent dehydrogenase (short-subunit alcohol dehydrogenase family)
MRLAGRTALVTGASGGLGDAIGRGLAREGADVACHYSRDAEGAKNLVRAIEGLGRRAIAVQADVRAAAQAERLVGEVIAAWGRLDILVNNAGIMNSTPFIELSESEWDAVIDTNLKGYFLVGQAAARAMVPRGYGRIVNVSSARQEQGWPGNSVYCAAKGGIWMLNRVMALELVKHGIRVNSIAPGTIETDMNRDYLTDPVTGPQRLAWIPAGRFGVPEDVVEAVILLASDAADFMVGTTLVIDGGQTVW